MNYRFFVLILSVLLNMFLVWTLVFDSKGLKDYAALKNRAQTMVERIKLLEEKNMDLSREIRLLQSDEKFIEQMIRKRLNYVRSNEIWYMFTDEHTHNPGEDSHESEN